MQDVTKKHLTNVKFMNKYIIGLFVAVFFMGLTSCNKYVGDYNPDFVGYWKADIVIDDITGAQEQSYMVIGKEHNEFGLSCQPNCVGCDCVKFVEGKAVVNSSKTKLRIGISRNSLTFDITKEPYQDSNGNWMCELDGVVYYKQ